MNKRKAFFISLLTNCLIGAIIFLARYSWGITLALGQAVPILLIPLAVSIAIFFGEGVGLAAGLFIGIFMDSAASDATCFNTLFLSIGCVACGVMAFRFLNRNLKAAICLSAGMSFAYYLLRYVIFYAFRGIEVTYEYFVVNLIPSAVYTALWLIPFYFLEKKLVNLYH